MSHDEPKDKKLSEKTPVIDEYGTYSPRGLVRTILNWTRNSGEGWLSRRIAFVARRIAVARLAGKPVDIEAFGARMRLSPYQNVCEKRILFTPQFFDPAELATLKARMCPGFVFIDIGANIGGYSLFVASHAGPTARVLALEPQPDIYERLIYNLRLNPFPTVKALAFAVADKDGELTMFIDQNNKGESSVKVMSGETTAGSIRVPCKKLLTLLEEGGFDRVDAVKLDTEGAEDIILETFFGEAPERLWPSLIIMERGGDRWHMDLPGLLKSKGYQMIDETRNKLIFERSVLLL